MDIKNGIIFTLCIAALSSCIEGANLTQVSKQLQDGQKKVQDSRTQLEKSYNDTHKNVINKLEKASNDLNSNISMLDDASKQSEITRVIIAGLTVTEFAPITATALVLFGDLPEIIKSLDGTLHAIQNTLNKVKDTINPINEQLNPTKDVKGVYAHLKNSQEQFGKAVDIVNQVIDKLKKIAEEV